MDHAIAHEPATVEGQLADVELLTLALGHGTMIRAARLLSRFGDLQTLAQAPLPDLVAARMTPATARRLQAALELGRRTLDRPLRRGQRIGDPDAAADFVRGRMLGRRQEELHVLGVDVQQRLMVHFVAAIGCDAEVQIDLRDVFRPLLREAAYAAVVVHNHPSGDPKPSDCDKALTARLVAAGRLVGVRVVDHVIVAQGGSFSFASVAAI